jgi:tripartite-type tricarboxylate transporter receptor subunit TctC
MKSFQRRFLGIVSVGLILISFVFWTSDALADYPERSIKMIVGWPAGGSADLPARSLCEAAAQILKQPIIVENVIGGSGTKSMASITNAPPDGYTIGFLIMTVITEKPHAMSVPYDPMKGFTPIMLFGWYTYGLVVRNDAPWKNFNEFIDYAKANPGKIKYGNPGHKSSTHLFVERLQALIPGLKMVSVPFHGGLPAMTALLGGHIDAAFIPPEFKPHVQSGELRMLAALTPKRLKSFPDVPTVKELGYPVVLENGMGILAPAGLPEVIRAKLQESFKEATKDKDFMETMEKLELIVEYMPGIELEGLLKKKYDEAGKTMRDLAK